MDDISDPVVASVEEPEVPASAESDSDNAGSEIIDEIDKSEEVEEVEEVEEAVVSPQDKKESKKDKVTTSPAPEPLADVSVDSPGEESEDTASPEVAGNQPVPEDNPEPTASEEISPEVQESESAVSGEPSAPDNPLLDDDVPFQAEIEPESSRTDSPDADSAEPDGTDTVRTVNTVPAVESENSVTVEVIEPSETVLPDPAVSAAAPSRWMGGPGEFSVLLEGQGWVFRSDLSTSGSWRFLSRDTEGDATRFTFLFEEQGDWNLVFERQDLSSGGSERVVRNVRVGDEDGPIVENGPLSSDSGSSISGNMPDDPAERNEAARNASEAGRSAEAISYWEKDAHRDDDAGRAARAALVEEAARSAAVVPLVTWLPRYLEDGADSDVLAAALDVLDHQAGYDDTSAILIEALAEYENDPRRPEWLYRLARRLEEPGEFRDLDRSAALYRQVVDGWPLSEWRDLSEERLAWLRRHYFRVR